SGVHIEAATNRSPSFSRSSSSVTTTISPALKAATTDSTRRWLSGFMAWRSGAARRRRFVVARRPNGQRSGLLDHPDSHGLDELRPLDRLGRDHRRELGGGAAADADARDRGLVWVPR